MGGETAAWLSSVGSWLGVSSVALVLSTTMAALWCACAQRSRARVRYAVWSAALALAIGAPLAAQLRAAVIAPTVDAGSGALALPAIPSVAVVVWSIGALVMLARTAYQQIALAQWSRRLDRVGVPTGDELTADLVENSQYKRFTLVRGAAGAMPVCWGILRARIMLPADAVAWPRELKRVVLRHELAHIEQRDALNDLLGRVVVALLWFHPAGWLVFGRLRVEREQACDERVIDSGIDPVSYGEQLLALARTLRPPSSAVAGIANRRTVETRIAALLAAEGRRRPLGARAAVIMAVAVVALPVLLLTPRHAPHRATQRSSIGVDATQLPGGHPGSFRASLTGRAR